MEQLTKTILPPIMHSKDSELMIITSSPIHGKGAYASTFIPNGTVIVEYTGEKITNEEADRREKIIGPHNETYIFCLNDEYCIDGAVSGNDAKYINHSCEPNCNTRVENDHIYIYAIRDIQKGEELFFDYEFQYESLPENRSICRCGSKTCRGFMNVLTEDE